VPHGHWKTTTFTAGLRAGGIAAPWILDGPMDGNAFRAYVRSPSSSSVAYLGVHQPLAASRVLIILRAIGDTKMISLCCNIGDLCTAKERQDRYRPGRLAGKDLIGSARFELVKRFIGKAISSEAAWVHRNPCINLVAVGLDENDVPDFYLRLPQAASALTANVRRLRSRTHCLERERLAKRQAPGAMGQYAAGLCQASMKPAG
jgi:hypothetical protein